MFVISRLGPSVELRSCMTIIISRLQELAERDTANVSVVCVLLRDCAVTVTSHFNPAISEAIRSVEGSLAGSSSWKTPSRRPTLLEPPELTGESTLGRPRRMRRTAIRVLGASLEISCDSVIWIRYVRITPSRAFLGR